MIGRKIPKVWMVPSPIRYVKVTNLYFEEVLLLGLLNGQVCFFFHSTNKLNNKTKRASLPAQTSLLSLLIPQECYCNVQSHRKILLVVEFPLTE